ncbi:hypothetical protein OG474_24655 [Kribbella sp. NBC_01505]|uniref:hypothetical protein n=1 Tax=Kribbella sp. NBC_01505 TaxID=2903580 RepID=UPI003867A377
MSDDTVTEVTVPQGTRATLGDLLIGLGGVLVDPDRAMLSLRDRRTGEESSDLTVEVGTSARYGEWQLALLEIKPEFGLDVARIAVTTGATA